MSFKDVKIGENPPEEVNVIVEIPVGGPPVKYELDKDSDVMVVDRFLNVAMSYPGNYGFIPGTLSDDGDPVDVLIIEPTPVMTGSVVAVRPIGVLEMEDESGMDEKIIAVPVDRLHPQYGHIKNYSELRQSQRERIEHFFEHYKDLERGKWVKIKNKGDAQAAKDVIEEGIKRAQQGAASKPGGNAPGSPSSPA